MTTVHNAASAQHHRDGAGQERRREIALALSKNSACDATALFSVCQELFDRDRLAAFCAKLRAQTNCRHAADAPSSRRLAAADYVAFLSRGDLWLRYINDTYSGAPAAPPASPRPRPSLGKSRTLAGDGGSARRPNWQGGASPRPSRRRARLAAPVAVPP